MHTSDLSSRFGGEIQCFVFDSLPSTNDYLRQLSPSLKVQICVSAEQTNGKGQYGRVWLGQKNRSVLLSVRYPFASSIALNGLSLVAGLAVINVLEQYNICGLKLKWPNDVYFFDKKIAGILVENTALGGKQFAVIGLGLNYQLDDDFKCPTAWTDLAAITTKLPDLVDLQELLIKKLLEYCQIFSQYGWNFFHPQWEKYDYLLGKTIELADKNQKTEGVAKGVNEQGVLIVQTDKRIIEVYSSAQIHLI